MEQFELEIVKTICSTIVWIVGLIIFGRLGMFIASKYFQTLKENKTNKKSNKAANALNNM